MMTSGTATTSEEVLRFLEASVARMGEAFLPLDALRVLCPASFTVSDEFRCLAEIADERRWSFAFLPGRVLRFAPM